jgi:hypothetical protein
MTSLLVPPGATAADLYSQQRGMIATAAPIPIPGSNASKPVHQQSPDSPRGQSLPSNYSSHQHQQQSIAHSPGTVSYTQTQIPGVGLSQSPQQPQQQGAQYPPLQRRPRSSSLSEKPLQHQYYSHTVAGSPYSPTMQQQNERSGGVGIGIAIPSDRQQGYYYPAGQQQQHGMPAPQQQSRSLDSRSPLNDAVIEGLRYGESPGQQSRKAVSEECA